MMQRSLGVLSTSLGVLACLLLLSLPEGPAQQKGNRGQRWQRFVIDDSSRGADGVRLADANGDGLLDITTGWEEGGLVRVYLHPGKARVKEKWPAVTVGKVRSPEDAVFVDVNGDGAMDVVSCCEGKTQSVFVHWAPKEKKHYLDPSRWKTEAIPGLHNMTRWMYCLPMQVDGKHGIDLILGSKNPKGRVGWLEAPKNPRRLADWKWHTLYDAGWIMSLRGADVDNDGDQDIVISDRKGKKRGCLWLENPGTAKVHNKWTEHRIGPRDKQVMFLDLGDLDGDGLVDLVVPVSPGELFFCRRKPSAKAKVPPEWDVKALPYPTGVGTGKGVGIGDIDGDRKQDLVLTFENARGNLSGVVWLSPIKSALDGSWKVHEISGPRGVKFDLARLVDLDGDGDLDVLSTEERARLGVVWYANPSR